MAATWVPPQVAMRMIGQKKLAQLTTEQGQQEPVGIGDGLTKIFPTPFYFVDDLKVYVDGAQVDETIAALSIASDGNVIATFVTEPADKAVITASSVDAVNGTNLDAAFLLAQADVRGMVDAALYGTPDDDATNVPQLVLGWAADIAWYRLMRGPRRPRLLEAYPEIEKAYIDTFAGIDATLKRVAKGTFSLRGVLPFRGNIPPFSPPTDPRPREVEFSSRPKVYTGGRGVF